MKESVVVNPQRTILSGTCEFSELEKLILEKLQKYGGSLRAERLRDLLISHTLGTGRNRRNALLALQAKGLVTLEGLSGAKIVATTLCVLVSKEI